MSFINFQTRFNTDLKCREYLFSQKWPNGFKCSCGNQECYYILKSRKIYQCKECKKQYSVTANTIFDKTRMPLNVWFSFIFLMLREKHGISSLSAQRLLGIKTYRTTWLMAQKIRKCLLDRDEKYKLSGIIEVDEALVGGKKAGKRGRGAEGRTTVLFSVEKEEFNKNGETRYKSGFAKATIIKKADAKTLKEALIGTIKQYSVLETDGWRAYANLGLNHISHHPRVQGEGKNASEYFPCVHRVISNLKGNLRGTLHGVRPKYLKYYLGEYLYRFNRRKWEAQLFFRGLRDCINHNPFCYKDVVSD